MSILKKAKKYGFTADKSKLCIVDMHLVTGNTAIAYFEDLKFFVKGATGLKPRQRILVISAGIAEDAVEANTASYNLDNISNEISKIKENYKSLLIRLHENEGPYNSLVDLYEQITELEKPLGVYPLNPSSLPKEIQQKLSTTRKRRNSLEEIIEEFLSLIDEVQKTFGDEDQNIFLRDLEAEISEENLPDGNYEIQAHIGENLIALMTSSGNQDGQPIYDFPNYLLGQRNIRLKHVDKEGIFYCVASDPSEADVLDYMKDLRKRINSSSKPGEICGLLVEAKSFIRYMHTNSNSYSATVNEKAEDTLSLIEVKYDIFTAEHNGEILAISPQTLHQFNKKSRKLFDDLQITLGAGYYALTCTNEDGTKPIVIFNMHTSLEGQTLKSTILPGILPTHYHKEAMTLLASKLVGHQLTRFGDVYLLSVVKFQIDSSNWVYIGKDKTVRSMSAHLYRFNTSH